MEIVQKEKVKSACHEGCEQSTGQSDPWLPPFPPCPPTPDDIDIESCCEIVNEWFDEVNEIVAASRRTQIIAPDRTPESLDYALASVLPRLSLIFEKDSTRSFLRLFQRRGVGMSYGFIITPLTFTTIIKHNALRCAKVALEGKAQALRGFRANPNCMSRYGYFPLHEAAELFCVDMIKLLFRYAYGANANVRTAGAEVIEGLLPLHVAVENTCLHKYLEGNAFPNEGDLRNSQATVNYICKLIHLLCLPEMKIFLDSIRLLGKHTENLIDEVWNYIKHGELVQTAILLLATQEQIRGGSSCKINGQNGKKKKQLEVEKKLTHDALLLVHAVWQAGESLDKYIMSHPEVPYNMSVPHDEVFEQVSSILRENGFFPTGEGIDLGNLSRYERVLSKEESPTKNGDKFTIEEAIGMHSQFSKSEKMVRNTSYRGWELKYARRSFFPYWKSVLRVKSSFKYIPSVLDRQSREELEKSWTKPVAKKSSRTPNFNRSLLERAHHFSCHQTKRMFCSAALPLLKLLRHA